MKILTLNTGSSSIKFGVYEIKAKVKTLLKGAYSLINTKNCSLSFELECDERVYIRAIPNNNSIKKILENLFLLLTEFNLTSIHAIGNRVVHGGSQSHSALIINDSLVDEIKRFEIFCPLHTPAVLESIEVANTLWPDATKIAVFDTSFHQTIPEFASTYAIPQKWRELGIKKYGFHGISHQWAANKIIEEFPEGFNNLKIISCHLGSGASMCAIQNGISIDNSMGASPLDGLIMDSRPGDLDPSIIPIISQTLELKIDDIYRTLFSECGLKALTGVSNFSLIESLANEGDLNANKTLKIYAYRIKKYLGSYFAIMGGVDCLIFTGGIGENSAIIRSLVCKDLSNLGITLDAYKNDSVNLRNDRTIPIHHDSSKAKVFVLRSNEQAVIAMETNNLLSSHPISFSAFNRPNFIPISVSARHIHLSNADLNSLFGDGYTLQKLHDLNQPDSWAAKETVSLIGPNNSIENVRILGPIRERTQIEISKSDAIHLGIDVPIRLSGNLADTPHILIKGAHAYIRTDGLIIASRHIHTNHDDANRMGLYDGKNVSVRITSGNRKLIFKDVLVRVSEHFKTEMHIDTDEANAGDISYGITTQLATSKHLGEVIP
ncbi:MAG: acetate/propionate family kinase [Methylococcales bacterium]